MEQMIHIHQDIHILAIGNLVNLTMSVFQEPIVIVAFVVLLSLQQAAILVNAVIGDMEELMYINV
jgi:hypothetical protein